MKTCQIVTAGLQICQKRANIVVRCANSLDDLQWVIKPFWSSWVRPVNEAQWYLTAGLTNRFFIRKVDGQRVSSVSFIDHGNFLGFASSFYVDNAFRGMGYGNATMNSVFSNDTLDKYTLYGCAVPSTQKLYNKLLRFNSYWPLRRYKMHIPIMIEKLFSTQAKQTASCSHEILPVSQANLEQLMTYCADNMILGSSEPSKHLLSAMISFTLNSTWVVVDGENKIIGFLIMHKTTNFPTGGYTIWPFFADNILIAQSLLKTAVEYAAQDCTSFISLDVPSFNSESVALMNELRAETVEDRVFVGNKNVSQRVLNKMYGMASLDSII